MSFIEDSGVPQRHLEKVKKDQRSDGPWFEAGLKIYKLTSTGCLMALIGPSGTGKTQIACNLVCQVCREGKPAVYTSAMSILVRLKSTYQAAAGETEAEVLMKLCRPQFLVIDEMEVRSETLWQQNVLRHLIDSRYQSMKDTLLISNCGHTAFCEIVGPAIVSRMNETGGIIICNWPSFRQ